jgi:NAD(P)H dehydrogenase (quinone)
MILVTCANGRLGGQIIRKLLKYGDVPAIRAGARTVDKIDKALAARCTLITTDYDRRATLDSSFKRVSTLVFVSGNAANELRIAQHREVIEAARAAGIKRIIYTSFSNPTPESKFRMVQAHVATERMLADSGIAHTILRNGVYAANLDGFVAGALASGTLAMPSAAARISYAAHDDLAAATAKVAMDGAHDGKIYELTGGEAVDTFGLARLVSEAAGRDIGAADIPLDQFAAYLGTLGLDEAGAADLTSIYAAAAAGEYAEPSGDLERLLGHAPIAMRDYIAGLVHAGGPQ